jgi:type IV conjugative transfer system protein TraL
MLTKTCYRTLDRPLLILGLEPGDLALTVLLALLIFIFVSQILGIAAGLGLGFGLRRAKRGRPPAFLYYLAYRSGLLRILPAAFRAPHLVRPPFPWEPKVIHLSPFEGQADHDRTETRFYGGRRGPFA